MSGQRTAKTVALSTVFAASACVAATTHVSSLQPGECFDDPGEPTGEVTEIASVDCGEPHDNEVYALFDVEGGDLPGDDEVATSARNGCIGRFEDYVGVAYADAELFATWLYPSAASWEDGDREVICVLFDEDRQLEGAQQGTGR